MWSEWFKRWLDQIFWWLPPRESERAGSDVEGSPRQDAGRDAPPSAAADNAERRADAVDEEPSAPSPPPAATRDQDAPPETAPEAAPRRDDLTTIKGIGPAMQTRLDAMGIHGFADLAHAEAAGLAERLKADGAVISTRQVEAWIAAAREHG